MTVSRFRRSTGHVLAPVEPAACASERRFDMTEEVHILILEDREPDAALMIRQLRAEGIQSAAKRVATEPDFADGLRDPALDLILADYNLPSYDGLSALKLAQKERPEVPFIFVSGMIGDDMAIDTLHAGATDYVLKQRLNRLGPAVRRALRETEERCKRRQAEEKLHYLLSYTPALVYAMKVDGQQIIPSLLSGDIENLLGVPAKSTGHKWWLESLHPEDHDRVLATLANGLAGKGYSMEYRLRHKDGTYRWIRDDNRVVGGSADRSKQTVGVWLDITERKMMEAEIGFQQRLLNAFFSGATAGMALLDTDLRYLQVNDTLAKMNKVSVERHVGRAIHEVSPLLAPTVEPFFRKVLQTGKPILNVEVSGKTRSAPDVERHFMESFFPVKGENGIPNGVGVIVVEITELKKTEQALRESEMRQRLAIENAGMVTWDLDLTSGISIWSDSNFRLLGYEPIPGGRATREMWYSRVHPEDRSHVDEAFQRAQRDHSLYNPEVRIIKADTGEVRWLSLLGRFIYDMDGNATRLIGVGSDITERKQAAQERNKLQAQLVQAQKMESVGRLAGGVAHDFNNILTVIMGYSDILLTDLSLDDPNRESIEDIKNSGQRAVTLTSQLLAFSRKQILAPRVVNLNDIVYETEKMLRRIIGEDVLLTTIPSPSINSVYVDPGQLGQVIINLAVNARDAMPEGGRLIVETQDAELNEEFCHQHPGSRPGRYVLLSVRDTGCGMTQEVMAQIFEPFFSTKGMGKGTGLGLSTIYGIVKQSDGYIDVESEIGVGTCFKIYLPVVDAAVHPSAPEEATVSSSGSETILLAEDDRDVRRIAKKILERQGYKVLESSNGQAAIALADRFDGPIDLLMTDIVMPGMNGRQLAEILTARHPGLKTLFVSGYTDDQIVRHSVMSASTHFLNKPFSTSDLTSKVRDILEGRE